MSMPRLRRSFASFSMRYVLPTPAADPMYNLSFPRSRRRTNSRKSDSPTGRSGLTRRSTTPPPPEGVVDPDESRASDLNLRSQLHDTVGLQAEKCRRRCGISNHDPEQSLAP